MALAINLNLVEETTAHTVNAGSSIIHISKEKDFVLLLVDLIVSDDAGLQFNALQILHSLYTQTATLGRNIQRMQLIVTMMERGEVMKCRQWAKDLNKLVQSCELWFIEGDKRNHEQYTNILKEIIRKLKSMDNIKLEPTERDGDRWVDKKGQESPFIDEAQANIFNLVIDTSLSIKSNFARELCRNMGIIDSLIELLKFYNESGALENDAPYPESIRLTLNALWLLMVHSSDNKLKFTSEDVKSVVLPFMYEKHSPHDYRAYFLLKELFKDNNQGIVKDMNFNLYCINTVLSGMEDLSIDDIRKTVYMDCLAYIINQKGNVVLQNQNVVIKSIFGEKSRSIFVDVTTMRSIIQDFSSIFDRKRASFICKIDGKHHLVLLPNKLNYILSLLNVLTICGDGKNAFSEGLGQKYMPLNEIVSLIEIPELPLIIKISLMNFCYHMYLDTEKEVLAFNNENLLRIWKVYIKDLGDLSSNTSVLVKQVISNMLLTPDKIVTPGDLLNKCGELLIRSIENLIARKVLTANEIFNSKVHDQLVNYCENLQSNPLFKSTDRDSSRLKETVLVLGEDVKKEKQYLDKKQVRGDHWKKTQTGGIKTYLFKKSGELEFENMPIMQMSFDRINQLQDESTFHDRYKEFSKNLANSPEFQVKCEVEFENLISSITLLDSNDNPLPREISFQNFSKSLINFLDPDNDHTNEDLQLMGLRIFRKYVESAVPETTLPGADWELGMYAPYINEIQRKQKRMIDIDIFVLVSKLIMTPCSPKIKMETILLCISLLVGGNELGQTVLHQLMLKDKDNKILSNIKNMIVTSFSVVKEKMVYVKDKELNNQIHSSKLTDLKTILEDDENFQFNFKLCTRLFRFLQLLCEGHNLTLQNFLRKQSDQDVTISSRDINFISDTCFMLGPYLKFCNHHTKGLGEQILDFLIDSVQGPCFENQKKLFNSKLIDFGKDFLMAQYIDVESIKSTSILTDDTRMITIVKKTIKLLLSLFEGNEGREFAETISSINFDYLINYLTEDLIRYYLLKHQFDIRSMKDPSVSLLASHLSGKTFEQELEDAFEIYFFINVINDTSKVYSNRIRLLKGVKKLAFDFFKNFSNHIEIVFRNNLQKVYFVIQPACVYLSEKRKDKFMEAVSRDTPNDKLIGLIEVAPELFDTMDHLCMLHRKMRLSPKILDTLRLVSLCVSVAINLIMFAMFKKSVKHSISYISDEFNEDSIFLNLVGYTHITCGCLLIVLWLLIEAPIVITNGFRELFSTYRIVVFDKPESLDDDSFRVIQSIMQKNTRDISFKERLQVIDYYRLREGSTSSAAAIEYSGYCLSFLLGSGMFRYLLFYTTSSIVALSYGVVLLYSFHLVDIISHFQTLQNVIKAITYNKSQLLLTAMLGLLIIYIYALFAYYYVNDTFYMPTVGEHGENVCTTVIQCLLTVISLGPRSTGSIGDVLLRQSFADDNKVRYYIRWFYDVTCFAVINIIFLNILFGIIIDTFAELRSKNNTKEHDKNNVCFICSLDRHMFENKGQGFEHHVTVDHNPWNYVFFLYNIKRKTPTEYNGIESFVRQRLDNREISWIPVMRALVVPTEDDFDNDFEKQLGTIIGRMDVIKNKLMLNVNR